MNNKYIKTPTTKLASYSVNEEIANSVSHGIGALLSVAGLTLLLVSASEIESLTLLFSYLVYGLSLTSLFLASTLYHAFNQPQVKKLFKLFDHCAIYLLIAGTYTPLMAVTLGGTLGFVMLTVIWFLALLGIGFKIKFGSQYKIISLATYLGMGFISLFFISRLYDALEHNGFMLLAFGGLSYASGVYFYVNKKIPFNHAIWHMFVLGGAICHFFMIYFYV
ncbi:hemolysin III family protein [Psychrosphaera sp. F3M07]|uniref:PAQR family membrane homeostasis protein TrhA n=1 Tax=Psychrosphaera sp. F3M07 TaxID=2841560 RepID=UPI001C0A607F|nr:hemolysin III family protein [Psychrosphaera sp. F3M07]MBU2916510.1 hemolysin III family protein [Psychrosphaera sp. F3M07]